MDKQLNPDINNENGPSELMTCARAGSSNMDREQAHVMSGSPVLLSSPIKEEKGRNPYKNLCKN